MSNQPSDNEIRRDVLERMRMQTLAEITQLEVNETTLRCLQISNVSAQVEKPLAEVIDTLKMSRQKLSVIDEELSKLPKVEESTNASHDGQN